MTGMIVDLTGREVTGRVVQYYFSIPEEGHKHRNPFQFHCEIIIYIYVPGVPGVGIPTVDLPGRILLHTGKNENLHIIEIHSIRFIWKLALEESTRRRCIPVGKKDGTEESARSMISESIPLINPPARHNDTLHGGSIT